MQHQSSMQHQSRIKGFDGLRAIAAALVIINHKFYEKFHLAVGGAGVRVFFILSGFLIISILHRQRGAIEGSESSIKSTLTRFYANRFYRIWPIYFLTIFASLLINILIKGRHVDVESLIYNMFFIGNIGIAYIWFDWRQVGVLWSVAVEEQFYLWAGTAFLIINKKSHALICLCTILVSTISAIAAMYLIHDYEKFRFSIDIGSLTNFGLIALGGLSVLLLKPNRMFGILAFPAFSVYLFFTLCVPSLHTYAQSVMLDLLIPVVLIGIVSNQNGVFVKCLDIPPVRFLGRISYGIYLYHSLIDMSMFPKSSWFDHHATYKGIVETILTCLAATLSWYIIEKPLLELRDKRRESST